MHTDQFLKSARAFYKNIHLSLLLTHSLITTFLLCVCALTRASSLSLPLPSPRCGRSFHTLCSDKTMHNKERLWWKSTAWSHQAEWRGNEHIAFSFLFFLLHTFTFTPACPHLSSPSFLLFLSLIHPRQWTDNPKGHLWPLSLAPPFHFSSTMRKKKKRENKPGGVSIQITPGR